MPSIRSMHLADVPAVKDLEVVSGLSPWAVGDYEKELVRSDSLCLVATTPAIVGFVIARILTLHADSRTLEILNISVSPEVRRSGIGRSLLSAVIDFARMNEIQNLLLEVRASNTGAKTFYEDFGFRKVGVRVDFYTGPVENAVTMERPINVT